jgi:leucyl-tRNA synthetase
MKLSNALAESRNHPDLSTKCYDKAMRALTIMLAPLAPHAASEMWERIRQLHETSGGAVELQAAGDDCGDITVEDVHLQSWPVHDPAAMVETEVTIVVQVGGKRRGEITVPSSLLDDGDVSSCCCCDEEDNAGMQALGAYVKQHEVAKAAVGDKELARVVVVLKAKSPLVNFVLKPAAGEGGKKKKGKKA